MRIPDPHRWLGLPLFLAACGAGGARDGGGPPDLATGECVEAPCAAPRPCRSAILSCDGGVPTCVETGDFPDGTRCFYLANKVCLAGACVDCAGAGNGCESSRPCRTGAISCPSGRPECVENGTAADGTACGKAQVCFRGHCVACVPGSRCVVYVLCRYGVTSCDTGLTCEVGGNQPDGTVCGFHQLCKDGVCE